MFRLVGRFLDAYGVKRLVTDRFEILLLREPTGMPHLLPAYSPVMSRTITVTLSVPPASRAMRISSSTAVCGSAHAAAVAAMAASSTSPCRPSEQMMNLPVGRTAKKSGLMPSGSPMHWVMMLRGMMTHLPAASHRSRWPPDGGSGRA